ncbi:MAG: terminase family protein [Anaerolineales bacterium]|nr:terminase family protein [Anaerolineales bacterium]
MEVLGRDPTTGLILHDKQLDFINDTAKRKVICAGRRSGKTTGVSVLAARGFVAGRRVLYAAPTQEQTDQFWEYEKKYFYKDIATRNIYKNEVRRVLDRGKGRIKAKTAWNAETMRGDYADLMFFEEYAMMDPSAWNEVGAPMLLDNDGDVVFMSTPKRRNHFHKVYLKAVADGVRWKAWHFTSHDNPYLSGSALEEITGDMTDDAYRQEILAEFLDNQGAVFRNIAACCTLTSSSPGKHKGHRIVFGIDWGKHNDFTVVSLFCTTCGEEVQTDRFNQIDYRIQSGRVKALADRWHASGVAESNAMGEPIIDQLQAEGVEVNGFMTTAVSKPPLIEDIALAFEREEAKWIDDPIGNAELEAYERKVGSTGRSSYSAPEGMHDDTVIAKALAWKAAQMGEAEFRWA